MIIVTCAIIRNEDNEVLLVQRGEKTDHPYKWEFPGGKTVDGESDADCIVREVSEELSIDIIICGRLAPVEHDYGNKQILLLPFICDTLDESPVLTEHLSFKWVPAGDLINIDFSEADIDVAKEYLLNIKTETGTKKDEGKGIMPFVFDEAALQDLISSMMSMKEADWMATSAIENPAIFLKLLEYSYTDDKKLAFRASWTLTKVCDKYPDLIYPYLSDIVDSLQRFDNESVQRSFLRIISISDLEKIKDRQHGILADHCFSALNSGLSAKAIKAYSMEILYKLSLIYPELVNELTSSIHAVMEEGSPSMIAKGSTILKKITEIPFDLQSGKK